MRVHVIYVEYGDQRRLSWQALRAHVPRLFPSIPVQWIVVDNHGGARAQDFAGASLLRGSNRHHEFSGWQEGLDHIGEFSDDDLFIFANDAFATNYDARLLSWLAPVEAQTALKTGHLVGVLDRYLFHVDVLGYRSDRWVRTALFMLRGRELRAQLPLLSDLDPRRFFAENGDFLWRDDAPMSPLYRQVLETWLTGRASAGPYSYQWPNARPVTPETRPFLRHKGEMILREFLFSAKFQAQGGRFYDLGSARGRRWGIPYYLRRLGWLEPMQNLYQKLRS